MSSPARPRGGAPGPAATVSFGTGPDRPGLGAKPKSIRDMASILKRQNSLGGPAFCKVVKQAQKMKLYSREASGGASSSDRSSQRLGGSSGNLLPGVPAPDESSPTKKRRASSVLASAELAADLQKELRQRMFGARHGAYAHSDTAARLLARRVRGETLTRREQLFLFLEEPGASTASFWVRERGSGASAQPHRPAASTSSLASQRPADGLHLSR